MTPDDQRHGTNRGYNLGCRQDCCRQAHMVWMKRYRMYGADTLVDATGTRRRIQGLVALGHTLVALSNELGMSTRYAGKVLIVEKVRPETERAVRDIYERLSMTVPSGWTADRNRRLAKAKGWAPPLAWDDIDNPAETPQGLGIKPARCGTNSGYAGHLRRDEEPCQPCRAAHRDRAQIDRRMAA